MKHTAPMNRREFLRAAVAVGSLTAVPGVLRAAEAKRRPNIIFIITDQQHAGMMSCTGNPHLKTPAMDRIAASGTRFELAYASNPVCLPVRFSFMTGLMPGCIGVGENSDGRKADTKRLLPATMGRLFAKGGYETVYGGKTHFPSGMSPETMGFRNLTRNSRSELANACSRFIKQKHSKPFLLVASFINPHDICYMAINDHARARGKQPMGSVDSKTLEGLIAGPMKNLAAFVKKNCPPLPDNYEVPKREPECIRKRYLETRAFRAYARDNWSDDMWRLHRWAYCRLTEMVDAKVGIVLDAVRDAGLLDDTLIVFASDHGDMDSAHRLEHKTVLYEESTHVPLMFSRPRVVPRGRIDDEHLVSVGLDILPTLCDFAGIKPPERHHGTSIRALAEGKQPKKRRDYLVVESQNGRMLRTKRFKYNVYDSGRDREQLFDLVADPGEMNSLAHDPAHRETLDKHRALLRQWVARIDDKIGAKYIM